MTGLPLAFGDSDANAPSKPARNIGLVMHQDLESALIILAGAVLVDCFLGEYPRFLHPVVWLGAVIAAAVRIAPARGWWRQLICGAILAIGLCGGCALLVWFALDLSAEYPLLYLGLGIFFLKA